jgi:signal peptidase I
MNTQHPTHHAPAPHPAGHHVPEAPKRSKPSRRESIKSILSTISILIMAPLIALLLITFVFQSYLVDGPSMENTLHNNDRLLVWKVPRTWARITGNDYIPKRGDVVVFTEPDLSQFGQDPGKQLIKRVVGLPGERVVIKNNTLTIYSDEHPDGFQPDKELGYKVVPNDSAASIDIIIPAGKIYVVGDNRSNSLDSRAFGPIDANAVVGKLIIRILPLNQITRF